MMKQAIALLFSLFLITHSFAQDVPVDNSPMDVAYFPADYPQLKIQGKTKGAPIARLLYSRPQKKGRIIFGGLIEYNKVWRLGANEATEIEFFTPVTLNHIRIKKGRYTLYAIPSEDKWTIIINKETDTWGTFIYDEKKDVVRLDVPTIKRENSTDYFSAAFTPAENGFRLQLTWDDRSTSIPFSL